MSSTRGVAEPLSFEAPPVGGMRIGVDRSIEARFHVDPAVAGCLDDALASLADAGADIIDVAIPYYEALSAATMCGWQGEAFALHRGDLQTRWDDYGRPTRQVMAAGELIPAGDHAQAQRVRRAGSEARAGLVQTSHIVVPPTPGPGA